MEFPNINVSMRSRTGKGPARRLRAKGQAPAVLYGKGFKAVSLSVVPKELSQALSGPLKTNTILSLTIANAPKDAMSECKAIVRDHQYDPVTRELLHVDFLAMDVNRKFVFQVPVTTVGRALGQQEGGTLSIIFRTLPLECLPQHVPAEIAIDVTALKLNQNLTVAAITAPPNTVIMLPPESPVVQVLAAKAEVVEEKPEEEAAAAAEGAAEGEEKKEGEKEGAEKGEKGDKKAEKGDKKAEKGDKKAEKKGEK